MRPFQSNVRASPAEDIYSCLTTPITRRVTLSNFTGLRPIPTIWIYLDTISAGLSFHLEIEPFSATFVRFRVRASVSRRPPRRSGREDFPHPVPRFRPFLPSRQPARRHPGRRITLLPTQRCQKLWTIPGIGSGWRFRRSSKNTFPFEFRRLSQCLHAFAAYSYATSSVL